MTLAGFETVTPTIKPWIAMPPGSAKTELEALLRMQCVDTSIFITYHRMKLLIPYHHEKES